MNQKFATIIESYINGNISWVKAQVKKLSKSNRKELYNYAKSIGLFCQDELNFFFNLI